MDENIRNSKVILNKIFDMKFALKTGGNVSAEDITATAFHQYYDSLRVKGYATCSTYQDVDAVRNVITSWRSFNDPQLPRTYEKYLVLSSIFGCEVWDFVFTDYKRYCDNVDFRISADIKKKADNYGTLTISLPRIRSKANSLSDKNGEGKKKAIARDRYTQNYDMADDCYQIFAVRKTDYDGLTLLDRISDFIKEKGCQDDAVYIENAVRGVYYNWKNRRPPSSVESLMMFAAITGMDIKDMYSPIYEEHVMDIFWSNSNDMSIDRMRCSVATKRFIADYMDKNGLTVSSCGSDYIITRRKSDDDNEVFGKSNDRYGIIVLYGGDIRCLGAEYNYVYKDRKRIIVVKEDDKIDAKLSYNIGEVTIEDLSLLRRSNDGVENVGFQPLMELKTIIGLKALSQAIGRYIYRETEDNLLIVDRQYGNVSVGRYLNDGERRDIVIYDNGKPLYGLKWENGVIPPIYDRKVKYGEGMFVVCKDNKYAFLDEAGDLASEFEYEDAERFSEGLAGVKKRGKYGFVDKYNNVVIDFMFDEVGEFHEGLATFVRGDKVGYIDRTGKVKIDAVYDNAFRFSEGVAVVKKDGKYGYIDTNGGVVLKTIYDSATQCKDGVVTLISCGKLINKKLKR